MQQQLHETIEKEDIIQASGRSAAGRKGGIATRKRMGRDFFAKIGSLGGKSRGRAR